ncbi:MAG: PASTA domain-containing protein [Thermoanaerobaculia bacterium]
MASKAVRALGWLVYGGVLAIAFAVAAYLSFSFFVRSGVTQVPELVGRPVQEVDALLADRGLTRRDSAEAARYDDAASAGTIAHQDPKEGSLVKRGSAVEVVVSLGPQLIEVPDLSGRVLASAQVTLDANGLTLGRTASVFAAGGAPGTVVEQAPAPGAQVGGETSVDLYLALDDVAAVYLMPDLVYREYDRVRRFFEARGFRLGNVKFEPYENIPAGTVLRQYPLPGHPLARRDAISLVVASGAVES